NSKFQIPSSEPITWDLGFGVCLGFWFWDLEFEHGFAKAAATTKRRSRLAGSSNRLPEIRAYRVVRKRSGRSAVAICVGQHANVCLGSAVHYWNFSLDGL